MSMRDLSLPDLLELLVSDAADTPFAFGVTVADEHRHDGATVELSVCDLPPSEDPLAPLIGMTAPASWDAFGLVSGATVSPATVSAGATGSEPRGVWIGVIVDRQGELWASMRDGDESPVRLPSGGQGQLLDLCKRVLGIPSAPPCDRRLRPALCAIWVSSIRTLLANRHDPDRQPHWDELAVLHPVNRLVPDSLAPLVERTHHALHGLTWAELHRRCASGEIEVAGLTASHCGWFDTGSFSRWVTRTTPPWESSYLSIASALDLDTQFDLLDHIDDLLVPGDLR